MALVQLPVEVLTIICSKLDTCSKIQLSKTCRYLNDIFSSKKLVNCMELSNVFNFAPDDVTFITNNKIRCQNIVILNIDGWYWTPRKELYRAIKSLINLEELYALDTKLLIQDIYSFLGIMQNLENISFTYHDDKVQSEALQSYRDRFKQVNNLFVEYRGSKEVNQLSKFLTSVKNYCMIPTLKNDNSKFISTDYFYFKYRKKMSLREILAGGIPGYSELLNKFLPEVKFVVDMDWDINDNRPIGSLAFPYDTLLQLKNNQTLENITKLCLRDIDFNFKNKELPKLFKNIRELYIHDLHIFDIPNAQRNSRKNGFKLQRLGIVLNAEDTEKQPIRTLIAACPDLEVLCIQKKENNNLNNPMMWYANCLKSIALWKKLRVLSLHKVESGNGAFLTDIAVSCIHLTHITLNLTGVQGSLCVYSKDLCESLMYFKQLQYINVQMTEFKVRDVLKALADVKTIKVIIIKIICKRCSEKILPIDFNDIKHLVCNLANLLFLYICDPNISNSKFRTIERAVHKEFGDTRKRLKVFLDGYSTENIKRLHPFFLENLDLTNWTYWLQ